MRRKTGNMIAAGTAVFCAATSALCGCKSEQIEYDTQGTPPEEVSQITVENQKKWIKEVFPSYGNGEDSVISINARITPPPTEELYEVEIEKLEFDEDYKKQLLRAFFGSNEIYYYDEEHAPRERLEQLAAQQQETVVKAQSELAGYGPETSEEWIKEHTEDLEKEQEKLYRLEELLATAPKEPVPAKDYSVQEYMGYVNGIPFDVKFEEYRGFYGNEEVELEIVPLDYRDFAPGELKEMGEVDWFSYGAVSMDESELYHEGGEGNQAQMSLAEALQKGKEFVELMGMGDTFCEGGCTALWCGESKEGTVDKKEYGYRIYFDWGIGNKSFSDYMNLRECSDSNQMMCEDGFRDFSTFLSLLVTDEGIVEVKSMNPIRIVKQTQAVSCLSIEQVQEIMISELTANPDCIRLKDEPKQYNRMEFIYFTIPSEEEENIYHCVPAWLLHYVNLAKYKNAVIVNALDGTIIDWTAGLTVEESAEDIR